MARKTKDERLAIVHEEALKSFDKVQEAQRGERLLCLKDRRFYSISGAQWEGDLAPLYENRPKFEVNKIHLSIIRIISEYRNNRISVNYGARGSKDADLDLADACDGMYRATEEESYAQEAYDNAFEEAVGGGFGAWRLRTEYIDEEDEDDDQQRIVIEPIHEADSCVFFDSNSKRMDKSDATKCWIISGMSFGAYEEEYGDNPANWPKDICQAQFDWITENKVYVAEYFVVETTRDVVYILKPLIGEETIKVYEEEYQENKSHYEAIGTKVVRSKRIKRKVVHKYTMSGAKVLSDDGIIAGKCIPVIPVYGKRWYVDGVERCMGHGRLATDVQRLKNMQLSKLGEISAKSSIEKPILFPEQVAGHQYMWENDSVKDYPYMLINPMMDQNGNELASGPVAYTKSPDIPPALAALLQITEEDIKELLGSQEKGEEVTSNVAERTVELIQSRLDMQTYIYMSNLEKAMKRSGEIWLSMARDIYVEEGREEEVIGSHGERETITLLEKKVDDDGDVIYKNDISNAKFKVVTDVGPSSSTRRQATVRNLLRMADSTQDPETQDVLHSMAMVNMEGEGLGDARDYFRKKLVRKGVVKPTEKEAAEALEEAQNTPPSAQDEYLLAAAAKEQTEAEKNQVETISEQAKADKLRAETADIIKGMDLNEIKALAEIVDKMGPRVEPTTT